YSLSASFSDANNDGPWSYTISWGDGSSSSGSTPSQGTISASHTYLLLGSYTITVSVTDSHGASGLDSKVVTFVLQRRRTSATSRPAMVEGDDAIEVVVIRLAIGPAAVRASAVLLSDAERQRASRFVFDRDAHRFIVARARLRQLLAVRLGVRPESVELVYGA